MAAQLIAAHADPMECYRCAMTEQSFERRREYLNQATRLSRALVALLGALQRRRDKAQKAAQADVRAGNAKSAKQPLKAPSVSANAAAESAKQPSGAAHASALARAKSEKQPSATTSAHVSASADSAKQPQAIAPSIVPPRLSPLATAVGTIAPVGGGAVLAGSGAANAKVAKQPLAVPLTSPRALGPLHPTVPGLPDRTVRLIGRAALVAALMAGTAHPSSGRT